MRKRREQLDVGERVKFRAPTRDVRTRTRESVRAKCYERFEIRGDFSGGKIGKTGVRYDAERRFSTSRK